MEYLGRNVFWQNYILLESMINNNKLQKFHNTLVQINFIKIKLYTMFGKFKILSIFLYKIYS